MSEPRGELRAPSEGGPSLHTAAPPTQGRLSRHATVIGLALFATYLASGRKLGSIPLQFLIKDDLSLSVEDMAIFFTVANFAWYARPLGGVLSDHVRIFGTRRRHYLLLGALVAACLWGLIAVIPRRFGPVLWVVLALNVVIMVAHSAAGGLLVDRAKTDGAAGPLTAMRVGVLNGASLVASLAGGFLATVTPLWTSVVGALPLLLTALAAGVLLRDEPALRQTTEPATAVRSVAAQLRSGPLWATVMLSFVYYMAPNPNLVLLYYRTTGLGFSRSAVGLLDALQEIGGMLGILAYAWMSRRIHYRTRLLAAVPIKLCAIFLFLAYRSKTSAFLLELPIGFLDLFSVMAIQELAVRVTKPKNEAFAFSLVLGLANVAIALSTLISASLHDRMGLSFHQLLWIQAASMLAVLVVVPLIPGSLTKDG